MDEYTADTETRCKGTCERCTGEHLLVVIFHPQPFPSKGDCQVIHCKSLPALPGCQEGLFHFVTLRMSAPELALLQEEDASNVILQADMHRNASTYPSGAKSSGATFVPCEAQSHDSVQYISATEELQLRSKGSHLSCKLFQHCHLGIALHSTHIN